MAQPPSLAQLSGAPVFNTKAVALETSVPPDTFRAWERRYGVPRPQRTKVGTGSTRSATLRLFAGCATVLPKA